MASTLIGSVYATFAFLTSQHPVVDGDSFWVAAAGREMLARGGVPRENGWSFVDGAQPWIMHEWLLGVPYALGLRAFGFGFLVAVAVCSLTGAAALVTTTTMRDAKHPLTAALLTVTAIFGFGKRFLVSRPPGLALLAALGIYKLSSRGPLTRGRIAGIVLIEWLWANAHGSFPLGIAILLANVLAVETERRRRLGVAAAAALVTLVNPYGLGLHRLVLRYLRGREGDVFGFIHTRIAEFAPLWKGWRALGPPELVALTVALGLTLAAFAFAETRTRGAFALALFGLAAANVRHVEAFGVLACGALVPVLDRLLDRARVVAPASPARTDRYALFALAPGLVIAMAALSFTHRSDAERIGPELGGPAFQTAAALVPDGAKVYVPFGESGLFVWLTRPRGVQVLYDERNDCYTLATAEAQDALDFHPPDAQTLSLLDTLAPDTLVLRGKSALARAIAKAPRDTWTFLGTSGDWMVLRRHVM